MNFKEHQLKAQETIRGDNDNLAHYVPKLFTEVAELLDMFMAHRIYGKDLDPINVLEECGDAAWYRANIFRCCKGSIWEAKSYEDNPFDAICQASVSAGEMMEAWIECHDAKLQEKIVDIFNHLSYILEHFGFTWSDAYEANVKKLLDKKKGRYKDGYFTTDAAVDRDVEAERELLEECVEDV